MRSMSEGQWVLAVFLFKMLLSLYFWLVNKLQLSRYSNSLWVGRSGDQNPVGARFPAPFQTGPGAHPVSYIMVTAYLSQG